MSERLTPSVQASNVTYELHTLGWKAFQDLCSTICGEIWGQTIQTFFDSRDGGRDGAFHGSWHARNGEAFTGSFTVQCKFTVKRDKQLSLADLADELTKARRLAEKGLADNYILLTNAHLTGVAEEAIREAVLAVPGVKKCAIYGVEWISRIIRESSRLRLLVPRVYGLGDLSQILDERAYAQAREILSALGDDLAKFVITDPFRQSAKALVEHGFVLLLGEPASGKSTIAASLAVGALDEWGCSTLKVRDADDFVRHSNPHEPKQFFWIDDAFGTTQIDWSAVAAWNRIFPHMHAAIRRGARVVMTSRDYIYRSARQSLKENAFPLIRESQVVIHVDHLTKEEREQILYNHIRLGTQPKRFRRAVKPHLPAVAAHLRFGPEIARRLGNPFFTRDLLVTKDALEEFVEKPLELLIEVIRTLDTGSRSALSLVFMRGGEFPSPLQINADEERALQLLGGDLSSVRESLNALDGSLVLQTLKEGHYSWRFKHPTIRDALAALVAEDRELLDIYLSGTPLEQLVAEISAGDVGIEGVKVIVPQDRYELLLSRLDTINRSKRDENDRLYRFLAYRCDRAFMEFYLARHSTFVRNLRIGAYLNVVADTAVVLRLQEFGLLPEDDRRRAVAEIKSIAADVPDASFLDDSYLPLFKPGEVEDILNHVRARLLPNLDDAIWECRFNYEREHDPDDHFYELTSALKEYGAAFSREPESVAKINTALKRIEEVVKELRDEEPWERDDDYYGRGSSGESRITSRSTFDDVDE